MTTQTMEAVYEHGIFRPIQPSEVTLHDGQRVRIVIETEVAADDILALATSVFDGLSEEDVDAIETIAQRRDHFFGNPR